MKETPEELRARMSRMGSRRMETLTAKRRAQLAYYAGVQGGRPVRIDHTQVAALRDAGKKHREIAAELGIGIASVARILKQAGKVKKRKVKRKPAG